MMGPDQGSLCPMDGLRTVCLIRSLPKRPNVDVVEYT